MAVLAMLEEQFLLRRARGNDLVETLISLSVAIIIGDLVLIVWGGIPKPSPSRQCSAGCGPFP